MLRAFVAVAVIGCGDNVVPAETETRPDPDPLAAASGFACDPGYARVGKRCDVIAPRAIAPLSTMRVTSQRPTLRWELAAGTDGARVELCADRACAAPLETIDVAGTSVRPSVALPRGPVFWRVRGRTGDVVGAASSATWEFFVGPTDKPVDTAWGTILDVDGDGYADVAVGAPQAYNRSGRVHVYRGGAAGLPETPSWTLVGPEDDDVFGAAVKSAGDVNGDGFSDLVVTATRATMQTGRAYLYLGGPDGLATEPATTFVGPDGPGTYFGWTATSLGDINSDGYADIAISAATMTGTVHIYYGGPRGTSSIPDLSLIGPDAGGWFGHSLASVDLDGDGHPELAVLAAWAPDGPMAYIYRGGEHGLITPPQRRPAGGGGDPQWFASGDYNGDGYVDLALGFQVYFGGPSGLADVASGSIGAPGGPGPVVAAGDLDGDGFDDIAIGAPAADCDVITTCGGMFVFRGGTAGPKPYKWITDPAYGPFDEFGSAVAGVGDLDGDGYDDLVATAPYGASSIGFVATFAGSADAISDTPTQWLAGPDGDNSWFGMSVY